MKITKLGHACLDISEGQSRLIVDPGIWTEPLADYSGVTALVITHVHPDHFDSEKVSALIAANPDLQLFVTRQIAEKITDVTVTVPELGKQYVVGDFTLEFFGELHAKIMDNYPQDQNHGVLVNGELYYPGDSFTLCPKPHNIVALPVSAPWLKFSEVVDFLTQDTATQVFPTHNNILNEYGTDLANQMLGGDAEAQGKTYTYLSPGQSL